MKPKHDRPLDFVLAKHGHADVPTYLKEIDTLRGLLLEAYRELSTIEAGLALPGGPDEIDALVVLVRRMRDALVLQETEHHAYLDKDLTRDLAKHWSRAFAVMSQHPDGTNYGPHDVETLCAAFHELFLEHKDLKSKRGEEFIDLHSRREKALHILTRFGSVDGDHHKAWAIDQAIRVLCGVDCGPNGYPGDNTNPEYMQHVYESCKDGDEEWVYSWDAGVAP